MNVPVSNSLIYNIFILYGLQVDEFGESSLLVICL